MPTWWHSGFPHKFRINWGCKNHSRASRNKWICYCNKRSTGLLSVLAFVEVVWWGSWNKQGPYWVEEKNCKIRVSFILQYFLILSGLHGDFFLLFFIFLVSFPSNFALDLCFLGAKLLISVFYHMPRVCQSICTWIWTLMGQTPNPMNEVLNL